MTIQMIITLAIVIGMIVMIMSDKFAFGAPPLIACVLLVLTGCATMSEAFAGFVDKNVIMIAGVGKNQPHRQGQGNDVQYGQQGRISQLHPVADRCHAGCQRDERYRLLCIGAELGIHYPLQ